MGVQTPTMDALAATFRAAVDAPDTVTGLLTAPEVQGLAVHHFPAAARPTDGRSRLELLLLLRSSLGDLIARPDVTLSGRSRLVFPDHEDAGDHDLVHDVVIEQGELDLEVPPSVVLARFGIHASGFGGIDPDPLYATQTVLLACYGLDRAPLLLRAHLTAPIHDTDIALPSSDLRDDLEALRQRIWRQYAYAQLAAELADRPDGHSSR